MINRFLKMRIVVNIQLKRSKNNSKNKKKAKNLFNLKLSHLKVSKVKKKNIKAFNLKIRIKMNYFLWVLKMAGNSPKRKSDRNVGIKTKTKLMEKLSSRSSAIKGKILSTTSKIRTSICSTLTLTDSSNSRLI